MHTCFDSLRSRIRLARFRFIKRVHRRGTRAWWTFDRASVARGVAVGLFFGVLTSVAQIVFAVLVAVAVRANLFVTALSTFVTNPLTLPIVYHYTYRIGSFLTERPRELAEDAALPEAAAEQALDVVGWFPTLLEWASSIVYPFVIGIFLLAVTVALSGYLLVHAVWSVSSVIMSFRKVRSDAP